MFIISGGDLLYYELRSGTFNLTHDVFGLSLSGVLSGGGAYDWLSVRPALHSKNAYNSGRTLGITWLRSGNNNNTNNVNGLAPSGGNNGGNVNSWLSVRPALHSKNAYNLRANA